MAISSLRRHASIYLIALLPLCCRAGETNAASGITPVDPRFFESLRSNLTTEASPLSRLAAARKLANLRLSDNQMLSVAKSIGEADGLVAPTLVRAFSHTSNDAAGLSLIIALARSPGAASMSPDEVAHVLSHFSVGVRTAAKQMLQPMGVDFEKYQSHLDELMPLLADGNVGRGKTIFFGKKAICSTCHQINGQGGLLGPDLGQISKVRTGRDLLESIIYPSAHKVPDFEPFKVETSDGQSFTGIMISIMPEAIRLRSTDLAEHNIETKRIKSMVESPVSLMPQGLANVLTKDELRDLLAYLQSLR